MKITALIDNRRMANKRCLHIENGLSLHIQYGGTQILLDTGLTGSFRQNAERLGICIRDIDFVVISHHHFDHGGGLIPFLEENNKAKVFLRGTKLTDCYLRMLGIFQKYVGVDKSKFNSYTERLEFIDGFREIIPGVYILTEAKNMHPQPKGNRFLLVNNGGCYKLDRFDHELCLAIRDGSYLVIFTGCSHRGVLNILDAVLDQFKKNSIGALFGGFHLMGLPFLNLNAESQKSVSNLAYELLTYPIARIYTGHCTGERAYRIMKKILTGKLEYFSAGSVAEI
jgi:7,8-dihydropterin-6-yl-methyl-4-(beta-D-ribofuranosyl)aminobenzene 5'-phosphate synthase